MLALDLGTLNPLDLYAILYLTTKGGLSMNDYRPRIKPGSVRNQALLKVCNLYKNHPDEFDDNELLEIIEFINEIGGRHLTQQAIDAIRGRPMTLDETRQHQQGRQERQSIFDDWDDDTLEHFLIAHPNDPAVTDVQAEIARRVRLKESQVTRIKPPTNQTEE